MITKCLWTTQREKHDGHLHKNLPSEKEFFPTRQVSAPFLKHLSPDQASSLQEDFGQKEVALFKATSSNSSFTSFDELISEEDTADLVEKLNNQHASVISSSSSLNRWNLDWNLKVIKGVNGQIMRQRIDKIDWIPKWNRVGEQQGGSRDLKPHLCKIFANPFIASQILVKKTLLWLHNILMSGRSFKAWCWCQGLDPSDVAGAPVLAAYHWCRCGAAGLSTFLMMVMEREAII